MSAVGRQSGRLGRSISVFAAALGLLTLVLGRSREERAACDPVAVAEPPELPPAAEDAAAPLQRAASVDLLAMVRETREKVSEALDPFADFHDLDPELFPPRAHPTGSGEDAAEEKLTESGPAKKPPLKLNWDPAPRDEPASPVDPPLPAGDGEEQSPTLRDTHRPAFPLGRIAAFVGGSVLTVLVLAAAAISA